MKKVLTLVLLLLTAALFCKASLRAQAFDNAAHQKPAAGLQEYNGPVYHIFFHSLILNPKAAFNGQNAEGFNMWMVTRAEFKKILPALYKKGFVLVRLNDLIKPTSGGGLERAKLMLPPGKKPLVISIDDVNYYNYMKGRGFADRLVLDKQGKLAAEVTVEGKKYMDYEGDAMLCIERFLEEHPDFSYRGARGIIALTAFEGVLGYRDIEKGSAEALQAKEVADALKSLGWEFACHSFSHSKKFRDGSITLSKLMSDTERFKQSTEHIIGGTNIYIPPFGMPLSFKDARLKYLKNQGYNIYCPVDSNMVFNIKDGVLISSRLNIDGFTMQKYPKRLKGLFEAREVIDSTRPLLKPA